MLTDPKKGDRYRLECGHQGRVVWVNDNGDTMAVTGTQRSCRDCGKKTTGNWTPTVYLLQLNDSHQPMHEIEVDLPQAKE